MKPLQIAFLLLALLALDASPAGGATAYTARTLFELPGTPARYLEFRQPTLNNRGEVLYGLLDRHPGVWLPLANYGRPAGINDLTAFTALPNRTILGFNDLGTFFHLSSDPSQANEPLDRIHTVYRGNVAGGETAIGSGYRLEDYPSRDGGEHVRRRAFVVEAITRTGEPVGKWRVDTKLKDDADIPFNWGADPKGPVGIFRGDRVLPLPGATELPDCANANVPPYAIRALSPGGSMLITRSDACPDLIQTLVLASPLLGERILARSGVGDPPPINPISRLLAVSDAGDAAGVDETGLWVLSAGGRLTRSEMTDIQAIRFNDAGQLFVQRTNDLHLWSPGGTLFPLALPWEAFGYQPNTTLRDVNNRAEFLISAQSLADRRTYAVLLSPTLSVQLVASTNQTDLGESLTLTAILTSLSDQPLTQVAPDGPLMWNGTGDWENVSGPEPNPPLTLAPGAVTQLRWSLKSTQLGEGHFSLRFRARVGADEVTTAPAFSTTIRIRKIGPDLLIKRVEDSEDEWLGAKQYHPVPVESQTRRADTLLGQPAEFLIVLGNGGDETNRFVLKAAEDQAPGWRVEYFYQNAAITDAIRSPAGQTMRELLPFQSITLRLVLTPLTAAPNAEMSVRILASFATQPDEPADVVEARATVRDLAITFTPERAILGEYVQVKMRYRNSASTPLSGVTGEIRVFGGGGGYVDTEISPPNLATLAPGAVALFTQTYVVTNTGTFRFTGLVLGTQADQRPLRVEAESDALVVGAVRFLKMDPIQVLPEVTLIQGKPTAASLLITNSSGVPKSVLVEMSVDDRLVGPQTLTIPPVGIYGYSQDTFLLNREESVVVGRIYPENGTSLYDFPGNSITNIAKAVSTRGLRYQFCYLQFPSDSDLPSVSRDRARRISEQDSRFLQGVYPIGLEPPIGGPFPMVIRPELLPRVRSWERLMAAGDSIARRLGLDRLVILFPRHASIWPVMPDGNEAVGWAYRGPHPIKHVVSVAQDTSDNVTSAHEIGHTFGFRDVVHPTDWSVAEGYWPEAETAYRAAYDLMDYAQPNWIKETHWELLVQEFTKARIDPEVVLVSGMLGSDGSVDAFPWHTTFVSEADLPEEAGTHAIQLRDAQGGELGRFPFTPGFEAIGDSFSTNQAGEVLVPFREAPFVFAVPRPVGLESIRLLKGPEVLFERRVTPHPPLVEFTSPLGGEVLQPGQVFSVRWTATDPDGGELFSTLFFSDNGGADWVAVEDLLPATQSAWEVPDLPTRKGRFKLQTTDGINTTERLSPEFIIQGTTPRLVASAGPDQDAIVGERVTLDGRGSHDSGGAALTLAWNAQAVPGRSRVILAGGDTSQPSFTPTAAGHYVFRLTVQDPAGRTAESRTAVHVREAAIALQARPLEGSQVELSWSDPSAGYELQSSPELGSPLDWQPATEGPLSQREGRWYAQLRTSGSHRFFRLHRKGPVTLPSPVVLQKDQELRLGEGTLTLAALDLGSFQLQVSGPGRLVLSSVTGTAGGRVTVLGPGTVEIAGAFSGSLEIRGGRVSLSAASLNTAKGVNLIDGTLALEAGSLLNSAAPLSLAGGVLEVNGARGDLGPLELAGNTTLRLGGGTGSLTFASARVSGASGRLVVEGWKGNGGNSGSGQTLFLKSAPGSDFLARVTFFGAEYAAGAHHLPTGELVPPAKALSVVPSSFAAFLPYGSVTKTTVAVTGQSFAEALRVTTTQKPTQVFNAGLQVKTTAAVAAQDNLLARFWVRKVAPAAGNAQTMFNFELASGSFDKSAQLLVTLADTNWQLQTVRFKALASYAAGAAQVSFWTGYALETIEIAGLEVLNYQGNTPP